MQNLLLFLNMKRIDSIDLARGLVMIIMTLDHTRDFLHIQALTQSPTNLATTTPVLFFTRWITHFCAPTFVFLSGVSAYLSSKSHPDARANRSFLLRRGIWLIVLEFTLVNFGLWMDLQFRSLIFEVIGTIGAGFIILSLLYRVSSRALAITALILIFGHDLLSSVMLPPNPLLQFTGSLLMGPGAFQLSPHLLLVIGYPVLPWFGIMLAGWVCGRIFEWPAPARKKWLLRIGLSTLGLFLLLRLANIYGDPVRWSMQKNAIFTLLSFLNVSKYPPSLLFTLLTLGVLLMILSFIEGIDKRSARILAVYGKTPLFYFLIHLYIIHLIMFGVVLGQGFSIQDLVFGPMRSGRPEKGSGIALPYVYMVWAGVVILLYPLCLWYGRYKAANRDKKWLRYL